MKPQADISGVILAGGAGRRVGGRDKGLILWRGKPLIAHVATILKPQVDKLLISCNRNANRYGEYARTTVADKRQDYQGPLAGLEAVAALIPSRLLVLAPCDAPLLPDDLVDRLVQPLLEDTSGKLDICYAHDGERGQYLCAALRTSCLASLGAYLDEGHHTVRHWYQRHNSLAVDFSDKATAFANYNRLD
jgi:molybdopterin-guanine dinucleotide biosynthesis protein A